MVVSTSITASITNVVGSVRRMNEERPASFASLCALDGRNRAIVIAELLARVIAAIRIASVRWRS